MTRQTSITAFQESVDGAISFHPFVRPAAPSRRGTYYGYRLGDREPYHYDAHDYMEDGVASATVEVIAGNRNKGKSAMGKSSCRRHRIRRADASGRVPRIWAFDLKPELQLERDEAGNIVHLDGSEKVKMRRVGEWRPLAEAYGCTPISVVSANANMMHPDFKLTFGQNVRQAQFLIEQFSGQPIDHFQNTALETAVWMCRDGRDGLETRFDHIYLALRRMLLQDGLDYHHSIDASMLDQYRADPALEDQVSKIESLLKQDVQLDEVRFRLAAQQMAATMNSCLRTLEGMFTGSASLYDLMSQDVVVFDFNNLSDEQIAIFQSQLRIIRMSATVRNDKNLQVDIENHEENYASWQQRTYGRDMFPYIKQVRGHGTNIRLYVQFPRDYMAVGDAGSEEQQKALSMLSNVDSFFLGGMPAKEIRWIHDNIFPLSEFEFRSIERFGVGDFLHKVMPTHQPQMFHYQLMSSDYPIVESNAALRERQGR